MRKLLFTLAALASASLAHAGSFSFTGSFNQDDDVQLFSFTVGAPSNVTLVSLGYAGGVNAAGNTIAQGGLDTILALFDGAGNLIGQNDDGVCGAVPADSATGACWDTYLFLPNLAAGTYQVAVMQFDNFAAGSNLADGFVRQGQGNFTGALGGCTNGSFCDVTGVAPGNNRTNQWAFDILGVESASQGGNEVPEPSTWALMGAGLAAVVGLRRRK